MKTWPIKWEARTAVETRRRNHGWELLRIVLAWADLCRMHSWKLGERRSWATHGNAARKKRYLSTFGANSTSHERDLFALRSMLRDRLSTTDDRPAKERANKRNLATYEQSRAYTTAPTERTDFTAFPEGGLNFEFKGKKQRRRERKALEQTKRQNIQDQKKIARQKKKEQKIKRRARVDTERTRAEARRTEQAATREEDRRKSDIQRQGAAQKIRDSLLTLSHQTAAAPATAPKTAPRNA